jgi:hypothetical protein
METHEYVATNTFAPVGKTFYSYTSDAESRVDYILVQRAVYMAARCSVPMLLHHLSDAYQLVASPFRADHRAMLMTLDVQLKFIAMPERKLIDKRKLAFAAKHGGADADALKHKFADWTATSSDEWNSLKYGPMGRTYDMWAGGVQQCVEEVFATAPKPQTKFLADRRKVLLAERLAFRRRNNLGITRRQGDMMNINSGSSQQACGDQPSPAASPVEGYGQATSPVEGCGETSTMRSESLRRADATNENQMAQRSTVEHSTFDDVLHFGDIRHSSPDPAAHNNGKFGDEAVPVVVAPRGLRLSPVPARFLGPWIELQLHRKR